MRKTVPFQLIFLAFALPAFLSSESREPGTDPGPSVKTSR
jgi:hypothetical protein